MKCWIIVCVEVDVNKLEFLFVMLCVLVVVWGECEVCDMYGLILVGLLDECCLVLLDDWLDEFYLLCKDSMDYCQCLVLIIDVEIYEFINELGDKKNNVVLIGLLYVIFDELGYFCLFVDGENIIDVDYCLFYVYCGMEKLVEICMGYNEVIFLLDCVCGICGFVYSIVYIIFVENVMGIQVLECVQMICVILLEVECLYLYLLNLGFVCYFIGFDFGFMQFFCVCEIFMKMVEIFIGVCKIYGLNLIGGICCDLLKEDMIQIC